MANLNHKSSVADYLSQKGLDILLLEGFHMLT